MKKYSSIQITLTFSEEDNCKYWNCHELKISSMSLYKATFYWIRFVINLFRFIFIFLIHINTHTHVCIYIYAYSWVFAIRWMDKLQNYSRNKAVCILKLYSWKWTHLYNRLYIYLCLRCALEKRTKIYCATIPIWLIAAPIPSKIGHREPRDFIANSSDS